jgi:hypothetical protein
VPHPPYTLYTKPLKTKTMAKGIKKSQDPENQTEETQQEAPLHYQEWRMERTAAGELEKLKLMRPCVKISDEEAEVLNAGAKSSPSGNIIMYFLPE